MYKLYTDRNETFECEVAVKNASLKGHLARLIVETGNVDLVFKGKIENGTCTVPIKKLKGLLEENTKGNMHLEVVVEDTYFKPWESDFVVEEHTSVKVQVKEQAEPTKPLVEVKSVKNKPIVKESVQSTPKSRFAAAAELAILCETFGITKRNVGIKKGDFKQIVNEYFSMNPEYNKDRNPILRSLSEILK